MTIGRVLTTLAVAVPLLAACTASPSPPPAPAPTPPPPTPTVIKTWGESIDNGKGVVFSVAAPEWVDNYDGRSVLLVTMTAENNGPAELSNVGMSEFRTDKGEPAIEAGPRDIDDGPTSVLAGESYRGQIALTLPAGSTDLRVTIAQGMSTAGAIGDQLKVNAHFKGAIPAPGGAETEPVAETTRSTDPNHCNDPEWWNAQQSGDPSTYVDACGEWPSWLETPETTSSSLESLCSDPVWRANSGASGDAQCGGERPETPNYQQSGPDCTLDANGNSYCEGGSSEENESAEQSGDAAYDDFCQNYGPNPPPACNN